MICHIIYAFIALRVVLCPFICLGDGGVAQQDLQIISCSCHGTSLESGHGEKHPCDQRDRRCPVDDPCPDGCVGEVFAEARVKAFLIDPHLWQSQLLPLSEATTGGIVSGGKHRMELPDRSSLLTGMAMRIAFESLVV
jgi:hypothetical protein